MQWRINEYQSTSAENNTDHAMADQRLLEQMKLAQQDIEEIS
jgi:hypothetical protein